MKLVAAFKIWIFLSLITFSGQSQAQSLRDCSKMVLVLSPGANNPRNSEGDFVNLKNGSILFIYSHFTSGSSADEAPAYLAGRYSFDDGKTWTDKDLLIADKEEALNIMSVSLLRLNDGRIALFYLKKNSDIDCIPQIRWSKDEGKTWSLPKPCIRKENGYFVLNNSRVIQLKGGRLLMPVSQHAGVGDKVSHNEGRIWVYYSDDGGDNWKPSKEIPNPQNILLQEPGIVSLSSDSLMVFMRSDQHAQFISRSVDGGLTWSPVKKSNIPSPLSPASIVKIPRTKNLLMVWNHNVESQDRTPLSIAISFDGGKSWEKEKQIEDNPKGSYCYTAIHFTKSEVLLSYFDWSTRALTIKRILLNCFYR